MLMQSQSNQELDIDRLLLDCVERGLDRFGSTFKFVVYDDLKRNYGLAPIGVVRKPRTFSDELDRLFGDGADSVKRAIVDEVATRFAISREQEDMISVLNRIREHAEK